MFLRFVRGSKWNLLYLVLAVLILLSIFLVPKIAVCVVERSRDDIFTVASQD